MTADERIEALITKLEQRISLLDRLDDAIARNNRTTSSLANLAFKLAATRAALSWIPGAIAGAIAGAVVTLYLHAMLPLLALR